MRTKGARSRRATGRRLRSWLLVGIFVAGAPALVAAQQREPGFGVISVAPHDGWYTADQAERGADAYTQHCVRCHGVELEGVIGVTPPLSGPQFLNRWRHHSLNRLFNYVKGEMPFDMPATLAEHTYIDIIAYVLRENGLPPGSDELRAEPHQLGKLVIPPSPGAKADDPPPPEAGEDPETEDGLPEEESGVEPEAQ